VQPVVQLQARGLQRWPEFFSDWDAAASCHLVRLDRELQKARRQIPRGTSFVAPILLQYDANDAETLTHRIRGLRTLAGRPIPLHGRHLDLCSDYVGEDIDIGLRLVRDVLRLAGAETPAMNTILERRISLMPPAQRARAAVRPGPLADFTDINALTRALD
jgi:opine dehydrogenase